MTPRDLPFQPWDRAAIRAGRKTQTRRCSGLAAVNREPDEWECGGENVYGQHIFYNVDDNKDGLLLRCPWFVGQFYQFPDGEDGVVVAAIRAERLQSISYGDALAEGLQSRQGDGCRDDVTVYVWPVLSCPDMGWREALAWLWDSIHRRDKRNRWERNPWVWVLGIERRVK